MSEVNIDDDIRGGGQMGYQFARWPSAIKTTLIKNITY